MKHCKAKTLLVSLFKSVPKRQISTIWKNHLPKSALICPQKKSTQNITTSYWKIVELFEEYKQTNVDQILSVPICNGLSGTMSTIQSFAKQYNIQCICFDTYVTVVVQETCIRLIKKSTNEDIAFDIIQTKIENIIKSCNILLIPTDVQHLKRGRRLISLTATAAGLLKYNLYLQSIKKQMVQLIF